MNGPVRILLTDAHSTSALATVRSLGSRGMRVTVVGERGRFNLAGCSRYANRVLTWPSAEEQPSSYVEQLAAELRRNRYDILIPITDTTVTLVRDHRDELARHVRVALPPNEVLDAALDKSLTIRMAAEHGVAVPRTWRFDSLSDVEAAKDLVYPCVVKPRFSRHWNGSGPMTRGAVRYAASVNQLRDIYRKAGRDASLLLVQELIEGIGVGVFVLARRGEPVATFAHRRLREANPTGGRASLAESLPLEARLVAPALRLLRALHWDGVAMVEFKDPGPSSAPVVMEVNGRFWGSLPLAITAGVDFPMMLVQQMLEQPVAAPSAYRVGLRCRHLKGDLSYLTAALKGRPEGWSGPFPGRLAALAAVTPWPGRWHPYNFSFRDPVPALREAGAVLASEIRSLTRRRQTIGLNPSERQGSGNSVAQSSNPRW